MTPARGCGWCLEVGERCSDCGRHLEAELRLVAFRPNDAIGIDLDERNADLALGRVGRST